MFGSHALGGVSVVAIQLALLAPAGIANAQSSQTELPAVTIDAPQAPARRAARKPSRPQHPNGSFPWW